MPSYPESVINDLRQIRPTFELRWNPRARVVKSGFDAVGMPLPPEYAPRWELWDKDSDNNEYKVLTVQDGDGSFRPVDQRLTDLVRLIDPAKHGGDVSKMIRALVDDPNNKLLEVEEREMDEFAEALAKWYGDVGLKARTSILSPGLN